MAKHSQLVCQHLENISREALEKHLNIIRHYVRRRQGVYALYRRGKLYYVGLATNLRSRLRHHLRDKHRDSWDRFSVYLTIGSDNLRELESLILRVVQPPGNKQKGKFARSENLQRKFRQQIKRDFQERIDGLFGETCVAQKREELIEAPGGRNAVLRKYNSGPFIIRGKHKGQRIQARVRRDGTILLNGKVYTSPSLAAAAACKRRTCNGWTFWRYERAPGDWVTLDTMRR